MKQHKESVVIYYNLTLFVSAIIYIAVCVGAFLVLLCVGTRTFTIPLTKEAVIFFSTGFVLVTIILIILLYTGCNAHMVFTKDGIEFRQAFKKTEFHSYREYAYVEKAFYMYYGMPMYYMVLGNRRLRNEEVCQINNVRPSSMLIKIRYNKKNYEAVLSIVPSRIALSLQAQFKDIPAKRFNFCI